jgi:hypothetical protein
MMFSSHYKISYGGFPSVFLSSAKRPCLNEVWKSRGHLCIIQSSDNYPISNILYLCMYQSGI